MISGPCESLVLVVLVLVVLGGHGAGGGVPSVGPPVQVGHVSSGAVQQRQRRSEELQGEEKHLETVAARAVGTAVPQRTRPFPKRPCRVRVRPASCTAGTLMGPHLEKQPINSWLVLQALLMQDSTLLTSDLNLLAAVSRSPDHHLRRSCLKAEFREILLIIVLVNHFLFRSLVSCCKGSKVKAFTPLI